jgi:hypothetical protein
MASAINNQKNRKLPKGKELGTIKLYPFVFEDNLILKLKKAK